MQIDYTMNKILLALFLKVKSGLSISRKLSLEDIKKTRKDPFSTVFPMNLVDYSIFKDKRVKSEVWLNLVHIAMADGFIHSGELAYLVRFASECGLSDITAKEFLKHAEDIEYIPPMDVDQKKALIEEMLRMALSDGDLSVNEITLIKKRTIALNLDKTYLNTLLNMYNQQLTSE
jgi:uncharacterized tellurite resistance protein B-like protein